MKTLAFVAAALSLASLGRAEGAWQVWEGFEDGATRWTTTEEGGLIQGGISKDVASEGSRAFGGRVEVLSLDNKPKAGFFLMPDADFSQVDGIRFDLFNGTRSEWEARLIIQTGADWSWNESQPWTIKSGWNRNLALDLHEARFGDQKLPLSHPELVAKIQILLIPKQATQGALYLDNIGVRGTGAAGLVPTRLRGASEKLVDGFEAKAFEWKAVSGAAARVEPDTEHRTQGRKGLKLVALPATPEQNGIFGIEKEIDLTGVQSIIVDVFNPGPNATLSLALASGANWDYAESSSISLKTGWNYDQTFNLQAKTFKSAASGWKNNGAMPDFHVRRIGFTYAPGDIGKTSITLDRLRLKALPDAPAWKGMAGPTDIAGTEGPWWDLAAGVPVKPRDDYSAANEAALSQAYALDGEGPALRLGWQASAGGQSADYEWLGAADLRGVRALVFDVYNPGTAAVDLALAVQVGEGLVWLESQPVRVTPGWNHGLSVPLDGPVFKSASTQWAYGASLPGRGPDTLRTAYLHVVPAEPGTGTISVAKVKALRRGDINLGPVQILGEGSVKAQVDFEAQSYTLWDSGASEGGFEKGLNGWQGINGGGFDLSSVKVGSDIYSQGKQALRVDVRGGGQTKAGIVYDASGGGPAIPDLSQVSRMRVDIYNAGPPVALSVAFTVGATNDWVESLPLNLKSGWNRDLTVDLNAPAWKSTVTGSTTAPGATQFYGNFESSRRGAGQVKKMHLLFQKARFGTLWVDNIRWGKDASSTRTLSEAQLGLHMLAGPVELRAAVHAGHSGDGNAYALPGPLSAKIQGGGQSLALSFGEALTPMDDLLSIYTDRVNITGGYGADSDSQVLAATEQSALDYQGRVAGMDLRAFGALPWGPAPFSFGGDSVMGLRTKAAGPNGSYLGAAWLQERLGYDHQSDIVNSPIEQSSQVVELDGQMRLPFGLSLGAAMGRSAYAVEEDRFLLRDDRGLPLLYRQAIDTNRDAVAATLAWSLGPLALSATYKDAGNGFAVDLSDTLYRARKLESKAVLAMDAFGSVKGWAASPGKAGGLARGMALTVEYLTHDSHSDTYVARTIDGRFENGKEEKLGYLLVYGTKSEDKGSASGVTLSNWFKPILRFRPWDGASVNVGGQWKNFDIGGASGTTSVTVNNSTMGVEASQRVFTAHSFSLAAGLFDDTNSIAGSTGSHTSNYSAAFNSQWLDGLSSQLSYGRRPFGTEFERAWLVNDPVISLSLQGVF